MSSEWTRYKAYAVTFTNKKEPGIPGRRHGEEYGVATACVIAESLIEAATKAQGWLRAKLPPEWYVEEIRVEDDTVIG